MLNGDGYESYLVGGSVRDIVMERTVSDFDITTNATPDEIIKCFSKETFKVIPTGLKHGTVTILIENEPIEITTYRIDGEYKDSRHPSDVQFTTNLKEDLCRRDFTINSLAYNPSSDLVDFFQGIQDIDEKIIRTVGNPDERFKEDALRMLRAIRFSSELGFSIDSTVLKSIKVNKYLIQNISAERKAKELIKILVSDFPEVGLLYGVETGLLFEIIPELRASYGFDQKNKHHDKTVLDHIITVVKNSPKDLETRFSALLHDIGKPYCFQDYNNKLSFKGHAAVSADMSLEILTRLKLDNKLIRNVCMMVKYHEIQNEMTEKAIKKFLNKYHLLCGDCAEASMYKTLYLREADTKGQSEYLREDKLSKLKSTFEALERVTQKQSPYKISDLKLNGDDLLDLGFEGKQIGDILNKLLNLVMDEKLTNDKNEIMAFIKEKYNKS